MSQTQYQKVREFMQAFGQECPTETALPSEKIREMRFRLIDEEREEWDTAKTEVDKLDAVLDLSYVILGAAIDIGIPEDQLEPRSRPSDYGLADINFDLRHATVIPFARSLINMMLKWVEEEAEYQGWSQWTMEAGFNEVHRSNMSKMWTKSQALTRLHLDGDIFIKPGYGQEGMVVVVNASGKIIKPPSYSKANLGPILEGAK